MFFSNAPGTEEEFPRSGGLRTSHSTRVLGTTAPWLPHFVQDFTHAKWGGIRSENQVGTPSIQK